MQKDELLLKIKNILVEKKLSLSTTESCTGGLLSSYLTDVSGASTFIFQNFVTYSNDAKNKYLGVHKETLEKYGAVSENTAYEMSLGLLDLADLSIATTGILGPTGGSAEKPVGLVYISFGRKYNGKKDIKVIKYISKMAPENNRYKIKVDIVEYVLEEFLNYIQQMQ